MLKIWRKKNWHARFWKSIIHKNKKGLKLATLPETNIKSPLKMDALNTIRSFPIREAGLLHLQQATLEALDPPSLSDHVISVSKGRHFVWFLLGLFGCQPKNGGGKKPKWMVNFMVPNLIKMGWFFFFFFWGGGGGVKVPPIFGCTPLWFGANLLGLGLDIYISTPTSICPSILYIFIHKPISLSVYIQVDHPLYHILKSVVNWTSPRTLSSGKAFGKPFWPRLPGTGLNILAIS